MAKFRNRVKEFRVVKASELKPSPLNWRKHPDFQQDAMHGVLEEVGWADAALARELPDGSLELCDGHLRQGLAGNDEIPVLVLDITEDEAKIILATHDPIGAMAKADDDALRELVHQIEVENQTLGEMLGDMCDDPPQHELKPKEVKKPPKMAWVLIGLPLVEFDEIAPLVEQVKEHPSAFVEVTYGD